MVKAIGGSAAALHALDWPDPLVPTAWLLRVERPALVLGSTQRRTSVDAETLAAAGLDLARRRSGGGAVVVDPQASVWIDLFIPRHDRRWEDDVSRSFGWVGTAWARALRGLGVPAEVHLGGLVRTAQSGAVCFAGLGPGEVTVGRTKAVGLSQRRTRAGARFQCICYRTWAPSPLGVLDGVDVAALPSVQEVPGTVSEIQAALLAQLAA